MQLIAGARLGTYEIIDVLGAGGMGDVYRARDVRLGREVALKVLTSTAAQDPAFKQRFEEEARSASTLNHPNIVTVYAVGEEEDIAYLAMELVQGRTLRDLLGVGPLSVSDAIGIAVQLTEALAVAHDAGIVHRDLKPENVIVTPGGVAKVLDFGLAKRHALTSAAMGSDETRMMLTAHGAILGTPGYMSPEQACGRPAVPASDQFALGAVLYEMLTGRRAFNRPSMVETLHAIIRDQPPAVRDLPPDVSPILDQVLARCLAKVPADRYSNTRDLGADLRIAYDRVGGTRGFASAAAGPRAGFSRRRALWMAGPVALTAVTAGVAWWKWPRAAAGPRDTGIRSLAVLPFENAARDADTDYLCDGITESLIRRIARLSPLSVKARSAVFNFKGKQSDPSVAGRQLGVQAILTGEVRRHGQQLSISAELVEVQSGRVLWSERYDRAAADLLKVQDDIAIAIVDEGIRLQLTREDRSRLAQHPTENLKAYEQFLLARQLQLRNNEEDYLKARQLLQSAITLDPDFALAHVSLAGTYGLMAVDGYERPNEAWPLAHKSAMRALELDPEIADTDLILCSEEFFFNWNWRAAEERGRRAVESRRMFEAELLRPYALERWAVGHASEAVTLARKARELDPLSPALRIYEADFLTHVGQPTEAATIYGRIIQAEPDNPEAYFGLAEARRAEGRFDEAIEARRAAHKRIGSDVFSGLGTLRGQAGLAAIERAEARQQIEALIERSASGRYVSPLDYARSYARLREADKAFGYFDASFHDRAPGLVFLNVDRSWDAIRDDPRFRAAVALVNLP